MRKILLVIDMQNDFIDGALGTAEAVAMLPRAIEEIKKYPAADIIATRDTHAPNYMEVLVEGEDLHNVVKNVRITGVDGEALLGEIMEG